MLRRVTNKLDEDFELLDDSGKLKNKPIRKQKKYVIGVFLLFCFICYGCFLLLDLSEPSRDPHPVLSKKSQSYNTVDSRSHDYFLDLLRNDEIVEIEPYGRGLSEKYICVLESGYQALIKPVEQWHYFPIHIPIWDSSKMPEFNNDMIGRSHLEYQGWGEIAGFNIDRAIGWNRKPPISGRFISNKILYSSSTLLNGGWKSWLPEYDVPVALSLWLEGVRNAFPSKSIIDYLTHKSSKMSNVKSNYLSSSYIMDEALQVARKALFDFLLDDHDSQASHNYMKESGGKLLHWDSGLAWRHGPYARKNCTILLCGASEWVSHAKTKDQDCEKLCKFYRSDYELLQDLASSSVLETLGQKVEMLLKNDPLFPVIQYGFFHIDTHGRKWLNMGKVRFILQNYLDGLDKRLNIILDHIEECMSQYGEKAVLL